MSKQTPQRFNLTLALMQYSKGYDLGLEFMPTVCRQSLCWILFGLLCLNQVMAQSTGIYDEVVLKGGKRFRGHIIEVIGDNPYEGSLRFETLDGQTYIFDKQSVKTIRRDVGKNAQERKSEAISLTTDDAYTQVGLGIRLGSGPLLAYDGFGDPEDEVSSVFRSVDMQYEVVLQNCLIINPLGISVYWDGSLSYQVELGLRLHLIGKKHLLRPYLQGRGGLGGVFLSDRPTSRSLSRITTSGRSESSGVIFSGTWDVSFGLNAPRLAFEAGFSRQLFIGDNYDIISNALFFRTNFEIH